MAITLSPLPGTSSEVRNQFLEPLRAVYLQATTIRNCPVESDLDWLTTHERAIAHIFDYHADEVAAQLEQAQRDLGVRWVAYPVDASLIAETCDACGQRMYPTDATFDGTRFLCPACRVKNG